MGETISDDRAKEILDREIIPYLKNDDYNTGILKGFNSIITILESKYEINLNKFKEDIEITEEIDYSIKIIVFNLIAIPLLMYYFINKESMIKNILIYSAIIIGISIVDVIISYLLPSIINPESLYGVIPFNIVTLFIGIYIKLFGLVGSSGVSGGGGSSSGGGASGGF